MKSYDAIVVGGGAGLKLVRPLADQGYKIAIIEKDRLGGTCLNRGCIPSKMLIHPADVAINIREAGRYDLVVDKNFRVNFSSLVRYVSSIVDKESESIIPLMENHPNIDYYKGDAKFIDPYTLSILNQAITSKSIILALGARPKIANIEGLENTPYMTSTEALRLQKQPKEIVIIGAGYIALELGHYFEALGSKVHFIVRSEFMRKEDLDIKKELLRVIKKRFQITYGIPKKVQYKDDIFTLCLETKQGVETVNTSSLLLSLGITPNTDLINLEKTNIKRDENSFIIVNDKLETSQKGIYAYGDVIGRYFFRHTANFEGEYLLENLFSQKSEPISYPPVPRAVFTYPQVAAVGATEAELKEANIDYVVGLNKYSESAMGMALRSDFGFVKLLFDKKSKELLGAHIIGEEASDMIHMLIAYMKMKATLKDLLDTIYIHPALPEIIRNAARKAKKNLG